MGDVFHAARPDPMVFHAVRPEQPVQRFPIGLRTIHEFNPNKHRVRFHPESCGKGEKVARRMHLDEMDND
jgi:hypothetical protein